MIIFASLLNRKNLDIKKLCPNEKSTENAEIWRLDEQFSSSEDF